MKLKSKSFALKKTDLKKISSEFETFKKIKIRSEMKQLKPTTT
jgi:hypothetical protein